MCRVLYEDVVGEVERPTGVLLSQLAIADSLRTALIQFFCADIHLSPPQAQAIELGALEDQAYFVVSAPTNSGKTLIALLRMFQRAIVKGARSVFVVPLKALAEEKAEEIRALAQMVADQGGPQLKVQVTTGDYLLSGDFLGSSPPESGEVIICTPERLDVILCNPDNQVWAESIDTYILDEFHLLGESNRGAGMESLVTRLLVYLPKSSVMALSATIGGLDQISGWLGHTGQDVRVLESQYRFPQLERRIIETDEKDEFILKRAKEIARDRVRSLLVFVYRKGDAEKLATRIGAVLPEGELVTYFHSGLPLRDRLSIGQKFCDRKIRFLIATTTLKMGVNTPATDVIVRDTIFHGVGRLKTADILQMLGRAGRGDDPGRGVVLCSKKEGPASYPQDLSEGNVEALEPQLIKQTKGWRRKKDDDLDSRPDPIKTVVLGEIARNGQAQVAGLQAFIAHCYSGWLQGLVELDLGQELACLEKDKLIYKVENAESTYGATKLGRTTVLCGLSPETGGMLGGFLRALINLSKKQSEVDGGDHNYLRRLGDIDLLFLAATSFEARGNLLRKPSKRDKEKVAQYIEQLNIEDKPIINLWRLPASSEFPTRRLLSSLRFSVDASKDSYAESAFYQLMGTAVLLHRHANGEKMEVLSEEYGRHVGTLDNGLKYTVSWVLNCLAQICSSDKCYKLDFLAMRIYGLIEGLTLGSTLGKLLTIKGVGRKSVQKLIDAGYDDISSLQSLNKIKLNEYGVTEKQAQGILRFVRRKHR